MRYSEILHHLIWYIAENTASFCDILAKNVSESYDEILIVQCAVKKKNLACNLKKYQGHASQRNCSSRKARGTVSYRRLKGMTILCNTWSQSLP